MVSCTFLSYDRGARDVQSVISGLIRGRWYFVFSAPLLITHITALLLLMDPLFSTSGWFPLDFSIAEHGAKMFSTQRLDLGKSQTKGYRLTSHTIGQG